MGLGLEQRPISERYKALGRAMRGKTGNAGRNRDGSQFTSFMLDPKIAYPCPNFFCSSDGLVRSDAGEEDGKFLATIAKGEVIGSGASPDDAPDLA